uniref:Uncharacterized protein n=1 Tax=Aegilops tauschii TaxID=37682 RepID=N1QZJ1_AEGTA
MCAARTIRAQRDRLLRCQPLLKDASGDAVADYARAPRLEKLVSDLVHASDSDSLGLEAGSRYLATCLEMAAQSGARLDLNDALPARQAVPGAPPPALHPCHRPPRQDRPRGPAPRSAPPPPWPQGRPLRRHRRAPDGGGGHRQHGRSTHPPRLRVHAREPRRRAHRPRCHRHLCLHRPEGGGRHSQDGEKGGNCKLGAYHLQTK